MRIFALVFKKIFIYVVLSRVCGCMFDMDFNENSDDLSWLTQRSPDSQPNFDLMSESEDDITVDETNAGISTQSFISIEDGPVHTSTQIYDGVYAEDISSDDEIEKM